MLLFFFNYPIAVVYRNRYIGQKCHCYDTAAADRALCVSLCVYVCACPGIVSIPCAAAHKVSAELATIHGLWQIVCMEICEEDPCRCIHSA